MRKLISIILAGALVLVMVGCGGSSVAKLRKDIVGEWENEEKGDNVVFEENGHCLWGNATIEGTYRILDDKSLEVTNIDNSYVGMTKWVNKDDTRWENSEEKLLWYLDGNKLFVKSTTGYSMIYTKK
jgi:hypothetical protein